MTLSEGHRAAGGRGGGAGGGGGGGSGGAAAAGGGGSAAAAALPLDGVLEQAGANAGNAPHSKRSTALSS